MHLLYSKYYYAYVICYLIMALIVTIISLSFFGFIPTFTAKSNSMSPLINTGSVVMLTKRSEYKPGDIISYYTQDQGKEEIVTHRIIRMGGNVYVTKGDANQAIDREVVRPRLVIGKVMLIIPYLGYLINFAKGPIGLWLIMIIPGALIIAVELYKIYFELRKNK